MVEPLLKLNDYLKQKKDDLLSGPVCFLASLQIKPNHLTHLRLLLNLPFFYFLSQTRIAIILFIVMLLLDGLDGALARYLKHTSDKGAFLDIFVDTFSYTFYIFAFLSFGYLDVFIASLHLLLFPFTNLLSALYYNEGKPSDWIMKPSPNLGYLKLPFVLAIFLFFAGLDYLNPVLYTLNISYICFALYFYYFLQKRWNQKT